MNKKEFYQWANETCIDFFKTMYKKRFYHSCMEDTINAIKRNYRNCNEKGCCKINQIIIHRHYTIAYYAKKREVIMTNLATKKITTAKCKKTDNFSPTIAIAICWARMLNKEIPHFSREIELNEMKYGERFLNGIYLYTFISPIPNVKDGYVTYEESSNRTVIFIDIKKKYEIIEEKQGN